MKKMNYLLVAAGFLLFMFFSFETVSAQSLSARADGNTGTISDFDLSIPQLVGDQEAIDLLSQRSKFLASQTGQTIPEEVKSSITIRYYDYLLDKLVRGESIEALLPKSTTELLVIHNSFSPTVAPEPRVILGETITLLKQ